MFVLGNFFIALAKVADILLSIMYWLMLIRALISWVNPDPSNVIVQFLHKATEPILVPIRRMMPRTSRVDFSVLVAFIIIVFVKAFVVQNLFEIGLKLKMM